MANISTTLSTYTSGGLDSRATLDGTSQATFQQMNGVASGVIAIETVLGDGPTLRGNLADLATRLAVAMTADGAIRIDTASVFTGLVDNYGVIADGTAKLVPKNTSPAGMVVAWTTASAPSHWLLCDGSDVSRTTYADLFAAIGITYGAGNGTTTFTLPDLRGRTIIMVDGAVNRITAASTGGNNADTLGGSGGAETHTLTEAQTPAHTHTVEGYDSGGALTKLVASNDRNALLHTETSSNGSGSGAAHSNTQPWLALNYIIYTGV